MRLGSLKTSTFASIALIGAVIGAQACGSDDNNSSGGSIALSVAPTSATVQAGNSTTVTGTIVRTSFTGDVAITVDSVPTGVTGSVVGGTSNSTTATVTISVASTTAPGTYNLVIHASGSGVSTVSTPFTLIVAAATAGSYTVGATPTSLSLAQGATTTVVLALNRTNFTGAVAFSAQNLATGVTATFSPVSATANVDTVTFTATSAATVGLDSVVIRGTATGMTDVVTTVPLTITSTTAAGFSFTATPANLSVLLSGPAVSTSLGITRTGGFAGTIAYTLTGVPNGLNTAISTTAGDTNTLTLTPAAGLLAGTYNIVVHANSAGQTERTVTVPVVVSTASGGPGALRLDYSACATGVKPVFVAYQDGSGAWTRATSVGDVYSFNITSAKGAIAVVTPLSATSSFFRTDITYLAQSEAAATVGGCSGAAATKTLAGTVIGLSTGDLGQFSLGGGSGIAVGPSPAVLSMTGVPTSGTFDLVGSRRATSGTGSDRGFLLRDQNVATLSTLPAIDFGGGNSFAPATATITVGNVPAGETALAASQLLTGGSCSLNSQFFAGATGSVGTNAFTVYGIPMASARATDFNLINATATNGSASAQATQSSSLVAHTLTAQTLALPTALPATAVTAIAGGPYKRLQATLTLSSDFNSGSLQFADNSGNGNRIAVVYTPGYQGTSTSLALTTPDISAASGFLTTWEPATTASVLYTLSGTNSTGFTGSGAAALCTEGATVKSSTLSGTI